MPDTTMGAMAPTFTPPTGAPNRGTSELSLDQFNIAMRASPLYQNFMRSRGLSTDGRVRLSRSEQSALENELARAGVPLPGGMHIDQGGNVNQKNRLGRNVAIAAAAAGAAFGGAALLAAGAAPAAGGGTLASTSLIPGALAVPGGAAAGGAAAAGTLASTSLIPGALAVPGGTAAAGTLASTSLIPGALATPGGGMSMAAMAPAAGAARVLPPTISNPGDVAPPNGGSWLSRGNNATTLLGMGVGGLTTYMGNRATNNANNASLQETIRQNDQMMAFLRQQEKDKLERDAAVEAEKTRQWNLTEAEKKRRYDAMQPYRDTGLVAMSQLANWSRPASTAYRPTFTYRPQE